MRRTIVRALFAVLSLTTPALHGATELQLAPLSATARVHPVRKQLRLQRSGDRVVLRDDNSVLATRPLANTSEVIVNGSSGDDTLVVDFSNGNPVPRGGITFHGASQRTAEGDVLRVEGAAVRNAVYRFFNANDGDIQLDDAVIRYTGLEPVSVTGSALSLTIDLAMSGANAVLEDDGIAGNGQARIRSTNGAFETTVFPIPSILLALTTSTNGVNNITVASDFATDSTTALVINTSNSAVFMNGYAATSGNQTINVIAQSVTFQSGTMTASGTQTYQEPATLAAGMMFSGGNVNFTSTVNGGFALNSTATGTTTFGGAVGGTAALASVTTSAAGATVINGGSVRTTGAQNYGNAVSLGATTTLTSTGGGIINFGSTVNGGVDLTLSTLGAMTFAGAVGGGLPPLTSITAGLGVVNINGGSVTTSGFQTYNGTTTLGANTTFTSAGNITFPGGLTGAFSVTKAGSGTMTLATTNTYTGGTTVSGGVLSVTGVSATGTGPVVVAAAGTLTGGGSIAGNVTTQDGGKVAPGNGGIGTLTVGGNVTWAGSSTATPTALFQLDNASSASDRLTIAGQLLKGAGPAFTFDFLGTGALGAYTLATFTTTSFLDTDFSFTNLTPGLDGTFSIVGGNTLTFNVHPPIASHFSVTAPASATAGSAFNFTVTALSNSNQVAPGYSGTVHFTSTDGNAVLPVDATLTNGVGTFSATLNTAGDRTITATDTLTPSITGTSGTIAVSAGPATHFTVVAPPGASMGIPFNVTVTARDVANNPATGYTGTVHFTSTDGTAVLPSDSTLTNGTGTFSVTLNSAGNHTVTATDTVSAGITGTSGTIAVASLHFAVSAPPAALPGSSFNFTVTALDVSNNVVTGYAGTVHFTSSDGLAVLPADSTLTNGTGTFSATLNTPGSRTITATDTVTPGINGTSSPITVPALHFVVSAPATTTAGSAFNVTVTALDASNSTVTGYSGTVHFTSTDGAAVLPADSTLTNGTGTFSVTLKTAGNRTITAKDTVDPTITGTSSPVAVSPGPTTNLAIATPSSATAGVLINVTVTARDVFNNTTPAYAGTIHFTSTDVNATLPADTTLTNGTGTFSATLKTAGGRRITATDTVTPALTVQSGNINVTAGPFATYGMNISSPFPQNVSAAVAAFARDAFNNLIIGYSGTASVTTSDANATVPATVNLNAGFVVFNVTMRTLGGQTITLTDVATPKTGTSNVFTVTPLPANHFGLTTPATAATGAPFNFTVQALAFNDTPTILYDRIIHFTSTDPSAVLPPDSTLTDGVGTFQATLNTVGAHTITATDTIASLMTNTSNPINVSLAPATHFAFTVLPPATAGSAFNFTITALDQFNNPAPGYTGTVHFTSSDGSATLPIDATLTNGTGTFSATFRSAGPQTITATDTVTGTIIGTSSPATVMAAAATHLSVTAAAAVTQGAPFNFTVTALDTFNNPDTGYAGTLHFTSSDGAAVLPANSTLTNGTGTFSATLNTAGAQTITATDTVNAGITGTTAPATVSFATLDLTMTQTVSASPYLTGMPVTYTIVVNNLGGVAATLVTVTDPLPAGMTFTTATPTLGTCVAGPPVTCSLGTIVSGGSASITLVAQLPATPGLIANTATVASSNPDSNPANDFASTQIAVVLASSIPTMSPLMLLMLALGVTLVAAMRLRF